MKGTIGIIFALVFGIIAAMFNYAYVVRSTGSVEMVQFVGIKSDKPLATGEPVTEDAIEAVPIPAVYANRLREFAILHADRHSVMGWSVSRPVPGGALLLRDDLRTPPPELQFGGQPAGGSEEVAMFVPVDMRNIVPSLLEPGDYVSFVVSAPTPAGSSPSAGSPDAEAEPPTAASGLPTRIIGKFKILSVGNRLTSVNVQRAAQLPQTQENILTISARLVDGELEPKARELWQLLEATGFRQVGIILHAKDRSKN